MRLFSVLVAALTNTLAIIYTPSDAMETVNIPTIHDMNIMAARRISNIQHVAAASTSSLNKWKNTLNANGTWNDVDMTSGCKARKANWPASVHLARTRSLASAYVNNTQGTASFEKANLTLTYWFDHDFTPDDCVDYGGTATKKCPCGTPGLWTKNWFDQVILVPKLVGDICLLLKDKLTPAQKDQCTMIQGRAVARLGNKVKSGTLTGANLLDVSSVGISLALLNDDAIMLQNSLTFFYNGIFINTKTAGDGIQSDGSFMQHEGVLYNGNYGKDFINDVLAVMIETKETRLAPSETVQEAFETLMSGTEWMIMADTKLNKLLWQYSPIGRMVSFMYKDKQASGGVAFDINQVKEGSEGWTTEKDFEEIVQRLSDSHTEDANQGQLVGTRYFYNSDYMVHRTPNYITTMKMYSTRTINSECVNVENPYGFHLSDGAIYNYLTGDEYVDVFGAWNWQLVPGITVDVGTTPLTCHKLKTKGKKSFVGGATDGNTGIAVMDFLNPFNGKLSFKKTAFFFPSGYAIQLGSVTSKNATAPLVTVLDQRKRNGDIYVAGKVLNTNTFYDALKVNSIWHDKIGYYFPTSEDVHVDSTPRNGNWNAIGISKGTEQQQLWTSYINHNNGNASATSGLLTQYVVQPNIEQGTFQDTVDNDKIPISLDYKEINPQVSAAYSEADDTMAIAFWTAGVYVTPWKSTTITSDQPCVLLLRQIDATTNAYNVTVADPSQLLNTTIKIDITVGSFSVKSFNVSLPTGNMAGKGVVSTFTL